MLQVRDECSIYSPSKVGSEQVKRRQLEAVVIVVLNLHAKPEPEWLQSGAGRPLLGRPA